MDGCFLSGSFGYLNWNPRKWGGRRTATIAMLSVGLVMPFYNALAATNCRVVEYPEHYEVVCVGEPSFDTAPAQADTSGAPRVSRQHRPQKEAMDTARQSRKRLLRREPDAPAMGEPGAAK